MSKHAGIVIMIITSDYHTVPPPPSQAAYRSIDYSAQVAFPGERLCFFQNVRSGD